MREPTHREIFAYSQTLGGMEEALATPDYWASEGDGTNARLYDVPPDSDEFIRLERELQVCVVKRHAQGSTKTN